MINLQTVLNAIKLAGSATPAFEALLDAVTDAVAPADQASLKRAYAEERGISDAAHAALQSELRDQGGQ